MISRIYIIMAKAGEETKLQGLLSQLIDVLAKVETCLGGEILHDRGNPRRFLLVERWTDQPAHEAARAGLPEDLVNQLAACFDGEIDGSYYETVASAS